MQSTTHLCVVALNSLLRPTLCRELISLARAASPSAPAAATPSCCTHTGEGTGIRTYIIMKTLFHLLYIPNEV